MQNLGKWISVLLTLSLSFTPAVFAAKDNPEKVEKDLAELAIKTKQIGLSFLTPDNQKTDLSAIQNLGLTSFKSILPGSPSEGLPGLGLLAEFGQVNLEQGTVSITVSLHDSGFKKSLTTPRPMDVSLNDPSLIESQIRETANSLANEVEYSSLKTKSRSLFASILNLLLPSAHAAPSLVVGIMLFLCTAATTVLWGGYLADKTQIRYLAFAGILAGAAVLLFASYLSPKDQP